MRARIGSQPLRDQEAFQRDFGIHSSAVKAARLLTYESYWSAVEGIGRGDPADVTADRIRETKATSSYVTRVAKEAATFAYEAAGSHGMRNPSVLQRCFRDIYVGAAHQVFDSRNFNELAKPFFGLEPAPY